MGAIILTVASTKGGVGKSTIATNIATAALEAGKKTLLIDADLQGTAITFSKARAEDPDLPDLETKNHHVANLHEIVKVAADSYDLIVLDVGGFDGQILRSAVLAADVLAIPVLTSIPDLWAVKRQVLPVVVEVQKLRVMKPIHCRFIVNQFQPNTKISRAVLDALRQLCEEVPAADTVLQTRVAYKEAIAQGLGVVEYDPDSKAANEIRSLYSELIAIEG